jgi:hypothetical protein
MTLPRSAADVLAGHVTLEIDCIDRMYLNMFQPRLQHVEGVVQFLRSHRGYPIASSALLQPISRAFLTGLYRFAVDEHIPVIDLVKDQRKDDLAHAFLAEFDREEGVLFIGRAQEKATVFRTEKRHSPITGASYPWIVKTTAMVNHFYLYAVDTDFGPFFIKFCSYFPYNAKLCINGNEWAKRQAAKAGIAFEPLDNGFASCQDPVRLQRTCDRLDAARIERLARKWLKILPHPFTPTDRRAGYRYDLSILQAEFSLTQMLDRPSSGRVFFETVIRENLDVGRPDRVSLIFDRRIFNGRRVRTPGRFRTRLITQGVTPSLHVEYKHTRIKQYHKEGRALRTETTINDTRDFRIGKRLCNLPALREVGFSANRRLLHAQTISHDPTIGDTVFTTITQPVNIDGQRVAGLRFGDPRVHALLAAIAVSRSQPAGLVNRDLRHQLAQLTGTTAEDITPGAMTYDLRRLRLHGLIERIPHTNRYRPTPLGWRTSWFYTHAYNRYLRTATADMADPASTSPLRQALDDLAHRSGLTA